MKIVVDPDFMSIVSFIHSIPQGDYHREKVFCDHRNTVELVKVGDKSLVIKKFKRPTLANCVIYTWFRKNKAERAWENAELFLKKGLETARPVAYIVKNKFGFLHTAYFISEYLPYPTIDRVHAACKTDEERRLLESEFARFTVHLHQLGIVHRDYNEGNILVHKEQDGFHFALIDINRLWLNKKPSLKRYMLSMGMLDMDVKQMSFILSQYADLQGYDPEDCVYYVLLSRHMHSFRSKIKHAFKKCFGVKSHRATS